MFVKFSESNVFLEMIQTHINTIQFYQQNAHTKNIFIYSFISIDIHPYTCFNPWIILRGLISYYTSTCMLEGFKEHPCLSNKIYKHLSL
jgi:hypothetical protein